MERQQICENVNKQKACRDDKPFCSTQKVAGNIKNKASNIPYLSATSQRHSVNIPQLSATFHQLFANIPQSSATLQQPSANIPQPLRLFRNLRQTFRRFCDVSKLFLKHCREGLNVSNPLRKHCRKVRRFPPSYGNFQQSSAIVPNLRLIVAKSV